ncbi:hypothetical protein, partial [Klebsiella pneumoniae]|uniref:hypothetical protein n=1 Tax=Klebsiella pneumoniae TaxID=573 RepID=UPI00197AAA14
GKVLATQHSVVYPDGAHVQVFYSLYSHLTNSVDAGGACYCRFAGDFAVAVAFFYPGATLLYPTVSASPPWHQT